MTTLAIIVWAGIALAASYVVISEHLANLCDRILDDRADHLATTDADWHETPTFRDLCAERPEAVDALAVAEAARADWDEPSRWAR